MNTLSVGSYVIIIMNLLFVYLCYHYRVQGRKELKSLFSGIFINDQIGVVYIKEIYG